MAQLVASASGVVLGGVAEVVGLNLARGKIFTASLGSVDSLYPYIYINFIITRKLEISLYDIFRHLYTLDEVGVTQPDQTIEVSLLEIY